MKLLLIDSTQDRLLIAVKNGEQIEYQFGNGDKGSTSSSIIPLIQKVLSTIGIAVNDLDCVFAVVGPGSFTGIRIGVCTAEAIGFGANIDKCSLTVFDGFKQDKLCVIQSRRGYCYYYNQGVYGEMSEDEVKATSDYYYRYCDLSGIAISDEEYVNNLVNIAEIKYSKGNLTPLEPMYLKKSQAERMREEKK